jgi:integrase/recombinase XerD
MILELSPVSGRADEAKTSYSDTADIPGSVQATCEPRLLGPRDPRWAAWLEQYRSAGTRDGYARDAAEWATWLARRGVELHTATDGDLSSYVAYLRDRVPKLSVSAQARKVTAASSYYKWAAKRGLVPARLEPDRRPRVHTDPVRRLGLPVGDVTKLIGAAAPGIELALVTLLAFTGVRISEACGADVTGVRTVQGQRVLYVLGKGEKPRTPPLTDEAWPAIEAYLDGRRTGALFPGVRTDRLSRQRGWELVKAVGARVKVEVHPHLFRHSAATAMAREGYSVVQIATMLGHEDISTTAVYLEGLAALEDSPAYGLSRLLAEAQSAPGQGIERGTS